MAGPEKGAKKESKADKEARVAKEKKNAELARAKAVKENAKARAQANSQKPAAIEDKMPKKKGTHASESTDASEVEDEVEDGRKEGEEDDDEELSDLPSGDPSYRVSECGLSSG